MTQKKWLKKKVRARAEKTGESYTTAFANVVDRLTVPTAPNVVLHGPSRFAKLGFRIDGDWGWDWIDNEPLRHCVFQQLELKVAAEQPGLLAEVRAALVLFSTAPEEVVVDYFATDSDDEHFWMGINLNAMDDVRVAVFLSSLHNLGWISETESSHEQWQFFREASKPASEFLRYMVETFAANGGLGSTPPQDQIEDSIAAALRLDEAACRASLAAADWTMKANGWEPEPEIPYELIRQGTSEPGFVSTVTFGTGRSLELVVGAKYTARPRAYAQNSEPRECVLVAVDHVVAPSRVLVKWCGTNRHSQLNIAELTPA